MNIIFITRCYKPTNIQRIKDNLKSIFEKQDNISYVQYLLVDLTYNEPQQNFKVFEDEHTRVHFTYNKKDHYNNFGLDEVIKSIPDDQNTFVYVLDDDNLINENFTKVFDSYQGEDIIFVNARRFQLTPPIKVGRVVGYVNTSNYIVKLKARKETPIYVEGEKSYPADGKFFQNLLKKDYSIKYLNYDVCGYNVMSRPLNVLRRDL